MSIEFLTSFDYVKRHGCVYKISFRLNNQDYTMKLPEVEAVIGLSGDAIENYAYPEIEFWRDLTLIEPTR